MKKESANAGLSEASSQMPDLTLCALLIYFHIPYTIYMIETLEILKKILLNI
jgi:hypothetical protein